MPPPHSRNPSSSSSSSASAASLDRRWGAASGEELARELGRAWTRALPALAVQWVGDDWAKDAAWGEAGGVGARLAAVLGALAGAPLRVRLDHASVRWFADPGLAWARVPLRRCSPLVCHLLFFLLRLHAFTGRVDPRTYQVSYAGFRFDAVLEQAFSRAALLRAVCRAVVALFPSCPDVPCSALTAAARHAAAEAEEAPVRRTLQRLAKNVA
jgi:hypothetical protein